MMKKLHGESGFTIVETMIVLAIAGLILLVVLLAIPSLERSSRNNQRRQDVQTTLAAISHYELSNSGALPKAMAPLTAADLPKLSFYNASSSSGISYQPLNGTPSPPCTMPNNGDTVALCMSASWMNTPPVVPDTRVAGTTPTIDQIFIYNHQVCNANGGGSTDAGASFSSVVALYSIETGTNGGSSLQCEQL